MLSYSHLRTEQLIYISALSKLRESAETSAVLCTNLNGIVFTKQIWTTHLTTVIKYMVELIFLLVPEWFEGVARVAVDGAGVAEVVIFRQFRLKITTK